MIPAPFASISEEQALRIAADHWGFAATEATRLDSEQDDSFRLSGPGGVRVLKIAAPDTNRRALALLCTLADWLVVNAPSTPLQRVLRTRDGASMATVGTEEPRFARLLTYLDGSLLSEVEPAPAQWREIGRRLAALDLDLGRFDHPDGPATTVWDLRRLPELGDRLDVIPDPGVRSMVAEVVASFTGTAPRLALLPRQFIHNDFNPGNLLVDLDSASVLSGVIDFGDAMVGPRVFDAAIAAAYAIAPAGDPWADARSLLGGYLDVLPLDPEEQAMIPEIVIAREAQRLVLNALIVRSLPQSEKHTALYHDATAAQLRALLAAPRPDFTNDPKE